MLLPATTAPFGKRQPRPPVPLLPERRVGEDPGNEVGGLASETTLTVNGCNCNRTTDD